MPQSSASSSFTTGASIQRRRRGDSRVDTAYAILHDDPPPMTETGLAIPLEGLSLDDWETVLVRARSSDRFGGVTVSYNLDEPGGVPNFDW